MVLQFFGLEICVPDLVWTIIDFFILFILLKIFLFKPLFAFMDKRDEKIFSGIRAGADAAEQLQKEQEEGERKIRRSRKKAVSIVADAGKKAKESRQEALSDARGQAADLRTEMHDRIEKEQEAARVQAKENLPEYAELLTARLLDLDDTRDHRNLKPQE